MNRVEISGRLTRDPEVRFVGQSDYPICTLNVAVDDDDSRWDRETQKRVVGSGFYRVEVPGEYGRAVHASAQKGDEVHVVGSLTQFQVGRRDSEEKETKTQVKAKVVTVLSGRGVRTDVVTPPSAPPVDDGDIAPGWDTEPF